MGVYLMCSVLSYTCYFVDPFSASIHQYVGEVKLNHSK